MNTHLSKSRNPAIASLGSPIGRSRPFGHEASSSSPNSNFHFSQISVHNPTADAAPIQRDEDENKLHLDLLPPNLHVPIGSNQFDLSPGGLEWNRGPLHGNVGWGSSWSAGLGYGAPLLPWTNDLSKDVYAGEAGLRGFLSNPLQDPIGNMGAIGAAGGTLGDVADSKSPSPWGIGVQGQYTSPEDWSLGLGLRLNTDLF